MLVSQATVPAPYTCRFPTGTLLFILDFFSSPPSHVCEERLHCLNIWTNRPLRTMRGVISNLNTHGRVRRKAG